MKSSHPLMLTVVLGLLLPGTAMAAPDYPSFASEPVYISQSLPPIQGGGSTSGYTPYGSNSYNNTYTNNGYNNSSSGYTQPQQYSQYSAPNNSYNTYSQPPLQGYVATAPAGTVVSASLSSPISSEFARVGDRFTVNLASPLAAGSSVLLPSGTQVEGQVVMVKPAGRTGKNGELEIRFNTAILPNGQRVPLSARIQTEDGTGILKGGTTGGRMGRAAVSTGVGAGLGAALGTAMGPLSGGGVGRGAIYGTALGAGMGALGAAWQKGKPATIETGQPVSIVLDQPLTTSPAGAESSYTQPQYQPYGQPAQQPYNY